MSYSAHSHAADPRNASILIDINGELVPRAEARVSVFDSAFMLGDGIWEGLRVYAGRIAFLDRHFDRLYAAAKALDFDIGINRAALADRLYATLAANGMRDGVHIRLMVSRGTKSTPYQDPRVTVGPATIVIIAEYKSSTAQAEERALSLFTVHVRRGYADVQDPGLNTHSKLNCIFACIQATKAGADEALMLDPHGFVATCNSTHFFIVKRRELWTSTGDYCLDGITRGVVIELAERNGYRVRQRNFTVADVYAADEAFVTGTFAGLVPVASVDGRAIGDGQRPVMASLQELYMAAATTAD
ncbi:MAG: aminotransferase class IV [Pseudomonadota bacterium]